LQKTSLRPNGAKGGLPGFPIRRRGFIAGIGFARFLSRSPVHPGVGKPLSFLVGVVTAMSAMALRLWQVPAGRYHPFGGSGRSRFRNPSFGVYWLAVASEWQRDWTRQDSAKTLGEGQKTALPLEVAALPNTEHL
jgi:hypothetical protein